MTATTSSPLLADLLNRHRDQLAEIPEHGDTQGGAYLRISEDREGDELGIDRHFQDLLTLFKARGWALDRRHVFVDNDLSAAGKKDRPDFVRMLGCIERGELKVITAWMLDRLLRNRRDQVWLYEACEQAGMLMSFARGSDLDMTTAIGQQIADIMAATARGEIKIKGERHKRAYLQAAQAGKPAPGSVPFGFMPDRITHHPEQAAAIEAAYASILAGGSLAGVARRWNEAGLLSGRIGTGKLQAGKPSQWSACTVRALLLKPRNAGLREYLGEIVGPAQWAPIVPEETWRAACYLLCDSSRKSSPQSAKRLLSGIALCGRKGCGVPCNAGTTNTGVFTYRCRSRGHVARRGDIIDKFVEATIVERLSRKDAIGLLRAKHKIPDVEQLRTKANTLRTKMRMLALEFADDDDMTSAQFRTANERLKQRIAEIEQQLDEAGRVSVLADLIGVDDVQAAWDAMADDPDRQRAVIDAMMTVTLLPVGQGARKFDPESIRIDWK